MEVFDNFRNKLELLLKKYAVLEADNQRLRATIDGQNKVIQKLNQKVRALEENMVSVRLDKVEISDDEKTDMRQQLDAVILEIDQILKKLND